MMDVFHAVLLMALVAAVISCCIEYKKRIEAQRLGRWHRENAEHWYDMAADGQRELGDLLQYKGAKRDYKLLQKKRAKREEVNDKRGKVSDK